VFDLKFVFNLSLVDFVSALNQLVTWS